MRTAQTTDVESTRFFDALIKDPETEHRVSLDLLRILVKEWMPNHYFGPDEYVRPLEENGYSIQISKPGTTAGRPPRVPAAVNAAFPDGSATWVVKEADQNSLLTVTYGDVVSEPPGMEVNEAILVDGRYLHLTYGGGQLGQSYDAKVSLIVGGLPMVFRHQIFIRKQ